MTSKASSLQSVSPPLSSPLPSSALPLVLFSFLDGAKPDAACVRERDRPSRLSYRQKPEEWPGGQEVPGGTRGGNTEQRLSDSDAQ